MKALCHKWRLLREEIKEKQEMEGEKNRDIGRVESKAKTYAIEKTEST